MTNKVFLIIGFLTVYTCSFAQKFDEDFLREHLLKSSYSIDTEAAAVILYEKGQDDIVDRGYHAYSRYDDILHIHRIIKILKPSALNLASVRFAYTHIPGEYEGYKNNVSATTYNTIDGKVVPDKMDKSSIYQKSIEKNHSVEISFTLPQVKIGSVIEYEYAVSKNVTYDLPFWHFQEEYPKLLSEFELTGIYELAFNSIVQGHTEFQDCKSRKESEEANIKAYKIIDPTLLNNKYDVIWGKKTSPRWKVNPIAVG